ncbi:MAG: hypothetical protein IJT48_04845 [Bacteroidaceae bacterium]|nr:hypothetical protein [Bacteroidaceae bacterium]
MKETFRIHFPLAILAGLCISIGCTVNMKVGGVAGAVLFAFGLTTVVYYGLKLYTGTAASSAVRATGVCCSSCLWATLWVAF